MKFFQRWWPQLSFGLLSLLYSVSCFANWPWRLMGFKVGGLAMVSGLVALLVYGIVSMGFASKAGKEQRHEQD